MCSGEPDPVASMSTNGVVGNEVWHGYAERIVELKKRGSDRGPMISNEGSLRIPKTCCHHR